MRPLAYLDRLLYLLVLHRDKQCLKCGRKNKLQASHIFSKGKHPSLRYDLANALCLCRTCHILWWHKEPMEAYPWVVSILEPARLRHITIAAQTPGRVRRDLDTIYLTNEMKRAGLPLPEAA